MRSYHDDVIKLKHFPRYWPFVRGIHRSPVNSPHKGQWRGALRFTLIYARLSEQSWGWWFKTLSCSLWRHCNDGFSSTEHEVIKFRITRGYHYMAATETGSDETIHNGFRLEYQSLLKLNIHVYDSYLSMDINSTLLPTRNYWTYCRFIQTICEIIMSRMLGVARDVINKVWYVYIYIFNVIYFHS